MFLTSFMVLQQCAFRPLPGSFCHPLGGLSCTAVVLWVFDFPGGALPTTQQSTSLAQHIKAILCRMSSLKHQPLSKHLTPRPSTQTLGVSSLNSSTETLNRKCHVSHSAFSSSQMFCDNTQSSPTGKLAQQM